MSAFAPIVHSSPSMLATIDVTHTSKVLTRMLAEGTAASGIDVGLEVERLR